MSEAQYSICAISIKGFVLITEGNRLLMQACCYCRCLCVSYYSQLTTTQFSHLYRLPAITLPPRAHAEELSMVHLLIRLDKPVEDAAAAVAV